MKQLFWWIALIGVVSTCQLWGQTKEYIRLNGRVVAIESTAVVGACASASNVLSFRSTGNSGSALLPDGTVDPNWKMVSNPGTFGGAATTDALVLSTMPGGVSTATAKFINATGTAGNVPQGAYIYRQKVDLSCHDPATVSISGNILADDSAQIYVNGKWQSSPATIYNVPAAFSISGSSGAFVRGWNQVDVVVMNTYVGENPTALRVEVASATASVVSSASGAKFDVTATPAGGNKNGSSSVSLSSGTESVTWAVEGSYTGTLTGSGANAASFAGPGSYSALTVVAVKATSSTDVARVSYQPLWFNSGGSGGGSVPSAPTSLVATGGNLQVTLGWTGSAGATSYKVKRSTTNGSGYTLINSPTAASYTDTGLTNGTTYHYVVTAVNGVGESGNSNQASGVPQVGNWYNTAWARRKLITVKPGQVTGTQLNFPMLVSLTSDVDLTASATLTGQASGNDILFTDATGLVLLPFEIESYGNGTLVAWVKVPSLADGSQVFLYYGNASTASLQNKTAVWDSNHSLVMHYASSAGLGSDSTAKGNNGTLSSSAPTATTGKIGAAVNFNNTPSAYCPTGTTSCQSIRNTAPQSWPAQGGPMTMAFWINSSISAAANQQIVFEESNAGGTQYLNFMREGTSYISWIREAGLYQAYAPAPSSGIWHHIVYTTANTGSTGRVLYVDGVAVGTYPTYADASAAVASYWIGAPSNWYHPLVGAMDEFRVSTIARSTGWISTEYKNQSSPVAFYDVGSEQLGSGGGSVPSAPTSLAATGGNLQVALSWTGSAGATSYKVKRSTTNGSGYTLINSPTATSYTDTGLTNGTTYYYIVTAVNAVGESGNSNQVSGVPQGAAASITLSSSGASQSVIASGTANFPISYASTGTTGQVTFSLLNAPAGANVNINPASVTNQGGASVTVSVSPATSPAGTYAMTFRATNGTITQTLPLTLTVVDCGTITVSPSNVNVYPFQMANFTAVRTGVAANFGVTWSRDSAAGSFGSALDPPAVQNPQISYFASDPSTQPQTVVVTARTNNPAPACSTFGGSATVTKQTYIPNGLSLLYTNPLSIVMPLNLSRFFDYGAASQNGAGTVRFVQLELRNNLGEISDAATACAINFETTTINNDPTAATAYAIAKVANNGAAGGSADSTAIAPRGSSASTQVVGTSSLWNCELDGTGSDYVRATNIFDLHMKVKLKSTVFSPGTIHVYVRSYGSDLYEPAIRQYMGSFTTSN